MTFTHLQFKSGYSFFKSTITIEKMIKQAKALNFSTLVLADEQVMHGAVTFYEKCLAEDIKPIIGLTVNFYLDELRDHVSLVLIAKSYLGYQNLMAISTAIQTDKHLDQALLSQYTDDLFCIQTSHGQKMRQAIFNQEFQEAEAIIHQVRQIFGQSFYFGVEIYDIHEQQAIIQYSRTLVQRNPDLKCVALQAVHYLDEKDAQAYQCYQAMGAGEKWQDRQEKKFACHFKTNDETLHYYSEWPELIETIDKIIDQCHIEIPLNQSLLPVFPLEDQVTSHAYLQALCQKSLQTAYMENKDLAQKRLDYELEVINKFKFSDYFLIVGDIVQFAKNEGIRVGPGRGSAAGSIVSYLLGITTVDPLAYDLLFERFLNPGRVSLPDIDLDILDTRRDEVIQYIKDKYGQDYVAQIVTFGTFQARSLLRELMKTMDISEQDQKYILKFIPRNSSDSLLDIIQPQTELKSYIKQSSQMKKMFSIAFVLEGLPRHTSTHAAGIIIGRDELIKDTPLMTGGNEINLTQYPMGNLEGIGLLKIDLLGLRNLTLIERVVKDIAKIENIQIDVEDIADDDQETYQLLQAGLTNGIFQLESDGMKNTLRSLKPTEFGDIVAVNALYRPGPMAQIPHFIKRKHREEKIAYLHQDLQPILEDTYGIIVYQEQIMQIANQFAGLSLGESDLLRRAISKKDSHLIGKEKQIFISGCLKRGYSEDIAKQIFDLIFQFANYGFNKSHAVAYSKISYRLSYLKAHYPLMFYAQFFNHVYGNPDKFMTYVKEAESLKIKLLPPSINQSLAYFSVDAGAIRFGLSSIKGIGYDTAANILKARQAGQFKSLYDFVIRTDIKRVNIETLILAGVFDEIYANRASLLASLDRAFESKELFGEAYQGGDLFARTEKMKIDYEPMDDFSILDKLKEEKNLLQMHVSEHPLKKYRKQLMLDKIMSIKQIIGTSAKRKTLFKTIAFVEAYSKTQTKQNQPIAFVTLSDESDMINSVIFSSTLREMTDTVTEDTLVSVTAEKNYRLGQPQLIIQSIKTLGLEALEKYSQKLIFIKLNLEKQHEVDALDFLANLAEKQPGETSIVIYHPGKKVSYKLSGKYNIYYDSKIMLELKEYFGNKNVVYTI